MEGPVEQLGRNMRCFLEGQTQKALFRNGLLRNGGPPFGKDPQNDSRQNLVTLENFGSQKVPSKMMAN